MQFAGNVFDHLRDGFGSNLVVGLQECESWTSPHVNGWVIHKPEGCQVGLAWASSFDHLLSSPVLSDECVCGAILCDVIVCTAYLPDSHKSLELYESAVTQLRELVRKSRRFQKRSQDVVFLGDLNVNLAEITGVVGPTGASIKEGHDGERQLLILDLLHEFRCFAGSTFPPYPDYDLCTHDRFSDRHRSILDYVMIPRTWQARAVVRNEKEIFINNGRRDHFAVGLVIMGAAITGFEQCFHKPSVAGWTPSSPSAKRKFEKAMEHCSTTIRRARLESIPEENALMSGNDRIAEDIVKLQEQMVDVALKMEYETGRDLRRKILNKPETVKTLEREEQRTVDVEQKQDVRRRLRCAQRCWARARLRHEVPGRKRNWKPPLSTLHDMEGRCVEDRSKWSETVERYCLAKYCENEESLIKQNERIFEQLERAKDQEKVLRYAPEMTVNVVIEARSRLKKGGAPGDDKVAVEMILSLPVSALYHFAELFRARYDGGTQQPISRWADIVQSFLPKDDKTKFMHDLRGISLLSAMLKWYTNVLVILAEGDEICHPPPCQYAKLATFGYVEGMSCQQVTESLRIVMSKCHEWQERAAVVLGIGDVLMAFDHMRPEIVDAAMTRQMMHGKLAAAFLREGRELKMHVKFQNVTSDILVPLNKCEKRVVRMRRSNGNS